MLKKIIQLCCFTVLSLGLSFTVGAQDNAYHYSVDLTQVKNDQLKVELQTPQITESTIKFYMPKLIPGTYRISDYGMFISEMKAFDSKGKELPVKQVDTNTWQISKANKMTRLTYLVEDIFDSEKDNQIFMMSASNIEENKNFVIQPPAFFGYFEEMKKLPFEISITKPENFYGSTGLIPVSSTKKNDVFATRDYDQLIDSPLMYNVPDTTFINVANAKVLISVYSPGGAFTSSYLAEKFDKMLQAQKSYLGGKLPVDKYAFILYFADPAAANPRQGALEHSQSSFYYLQEAPKELLAPYLVDIAAHEFFHIITPLTIHSKEIAHFNFNEPVLSKHLWLYEGVTEYVSDHVQVRSNLITPEEFLSKLTEKLETSQKAYNDTLPFTTLSKQSAGKYASQYPNVYEKGALIAAMLDIHLLELSKGKIDLQDLMLALSKKYGKNTPFDDDQLFAQIEAMTFPEIGGFFKQYVAGSKSLPYEDYFHKVGIDYIREADKKLATLGKPGIGYNQEKQMLEVSHINGVNEFGKNLGYQAGDLLVSLQGEALSPATIGGIAENFSNRTKAGEKVELVVLRKNETGEYKEVTLTAPAVIVNVPGKLKLQLNPNADLKQLKLRNAWMQENPVTASPEDVRSIDAVIKAVYSVISGPAGERDWDRFHSLFKPDAGMGAMAPTKGGSLTYKRMTPKEYQEMNAPYFSQYGFYEEEIGRETSIFGEVAHVWSAYEFKSSPEGATQQRGINSIQLVFDQGRWWVTNILWNSERPGNPIPVDLIKKN